MASLAFVVETKSIGGMRSQMKGGILIWFGLKFAKCSISGRPLCFSCCSSSNFPARSALPSSPNFFAMIDNIRADPCHLDSWSCKPPVPRRQWCFGLTFLKNIFLGETETLAAISPMYSPWPVRDDVTSRNRSVVAKCWMF